MVGRLTVNGYRALVQIQPEDMRHLIIKYSFDELVNGKKKLLIGIINWHRLFFGTYSRSTKIYKNSLFYTVNWHRLSFGTYYWDTLCFKTSFIVLNIRFLTTSDDKSSPSTAEEAWSRGFYLYEKGITKTLGPVSVEEYNNWLRIEKHREMVRSIVGMTSDEKYDKEARLERQASYQSLPGSPAQEAGNRNNFQEVMPCKPRYYNIQKGTFFFCEEFFDSLQSALGDFDSFEHKSADEQNHHAQLMSELALTDRSQRVSSSDQLFSSIEVEHFVELFQRYFSPSERICDSRSRKKYGLEILASFSKELLFFLVKEGAPFLPEEKDWLYNRQLVNSIIQQTVSDLNPWDLGDVILKICTKKVIDDNINRLKFPQKDWGDLFLSVEQQFVMYSLQQFLVLCLTKNLYKNIEAGLGGSCLANETTVVNYAVSFLNTHKIALHELNWFKGSYQIAMILIGFFVRTDFVRSVQIRSETKESRNVTLLFLDQGLMRLKPFQSHLPQIYPPRCVDTPKNFQDFVACVPYNREGSQIVPSEMTLTICNLLQQKQYQINPVLLNILRPSFHKKNLKVRGTWGGILPVPTWDRKREMSLSQQMLQAMLLLADFYQKFPLYYRTKMNFLGKIDPWEFLLSRTTGDVKHVLSDFKSEKLTRKGLTHLMSAFYGSLYGERFYTNWLSELAQMEPNDDAPGIDDEGFFMELHMHYVSIITGAKFDNKPMEFYLLTLKKILSKTLETQELEIPVSIYIELKQKTSGIDIMSILLGIPSLAQKAGLFGEGSESIYSTVVDHLKNFLEESFGLEMGTETLDKDRVLGLLITNPICVQGLVNNWVFSQGKVKQRQDLIDGFQKCYSNKPNDSEYQAIKSLLREFDRLMESLFPNIVEQKRCFEKVLEIRLRSCAWDKIMNIRTLDGSDLSWGLNPVALKTIKYWDPVLNKNKQVRMNAPCSFDSLSRQEQIKWQKGYFQSLFPNLIDSVNAAILRLIAYQVHAKTGYIINHLHSSVLCHPNLVEAVYSSIEEIYTNGSLCDLADKIFFNPMKKGLSITDQRKIDEIKGQFFVNGESIHLEKNFFKAHFVYTLRDVSL